MVAFKTQLLPDYVPNLRAHHGQCELNFHLVMSLVPDCRFGKREWQFTLPSTPSALNIQITLLDLAPYTTTFQITQVMAASPTVAVPSFINMPVLTVRAYHDVEMAEVVAWDNHRHWFPLYVYPNRKMYHRDEKVVLNRFLGEWLVHCRKLGFSSTGFVNPLP